MKDIEKFLPLLKDKAIQIYIGDEYEQLNLVDNQQQINGSIYGILKGIIGEFLIVDCFYLNKDGQLKSDNIVYINTWQIKCMTSIEKEASLSDVLLSTSHINKIKRLISNRVK